MHFGQGSDMGGNVFLRSLPRSGRSLGVRSPEQFGLNRARGSSAASRSISRSPMPGFLALSSAMMRTRSGDVQDR